MSDVRADVWNDLDCYLPRSGNALTSALLFNIGRVKLFGILRAGAPSAIFSVDLRAERESDDFYHRSALGIHR